MCECLGLVGCGWVGLSVYTFGRGGGVLHGGGGAVSFRLCVVGCAKCGGRDSGIVFVWLVCGSRCWVMLGEGYRCFRFHQVKWSRSGVEWMGYMEVG